MAKETAAAKGSNGNEKKDSQGRKLYTVSTTIDGETFTRDVPLIGIPFWTPQKREEQPRIIVGTVEEIVTIPAGDNGFKERSGILLQLKDGTHYVVPASTSIENQIKELKLGAGERILVEYAGHSSKSKPGMQPALRMNISVYQGKSTVAAQTIVG